MIKCTNAKKDLILTVLIYCAPGQKFQPGNQKVDVHADMIALTLPKMTRNIHAFQYSDFSQNTFTNMESRPKSELRRQQIDLFIQVSNLERLQTSKYPTTLKEDKFNSAK